MMEHELMELGVVILAGLAITGLAVLYIMWPY